MDHATCTVRVPTGYVVGGWRVGEALASGSWSSVYSAARVGPGEPRVAALKFIPTGTLTSRQLSHLADMAEREVAVHRRVEHPGLIRVLDIIVIDDPECPALDGVTVLALELATESAAVALERADGDGRPGGGGGGRPGGGGGGRPGGGGGGRPGGGGLPDAPRIIAEVCGALAHLHRAGWVHGDLKPGNILLMPDGSARLADFGLAAEIDGTHAYLPPGGTSDYVPPERWAEPVRGQGTAVRQTADIWAVGIVACRLLTGRLPFPGVTARARASAATAYATGQAPLSLPAELTEPWRGFIADCLAPDHATRRRHDASSLHRRALEIVAGDPVRRFRYTRRRVVAATASLLGVAGAVAGLVWAFPAGHRADAVASQTAKYDHDFRTDADIPPEYYDLIVEAGTMCPENKAVSPVLVAAMLKDESGFDPALSDPAADEYGIARWTPGVLKFYLPAGQRDKIPAPPFPPEMSIPAVGRYLCWMAPKLEEVPGSPEENLAAAYRTSTDVVRNAHGIPTDRPKLTLYIDHLRTYLARYRPAGATAPTPVG